MKGDPHPDGLAQPDRRERKNAPASKTAGWLVQCPFNIKTRDVFAASDDDVLSYDPQWSHSRPHPASPNPRCAASRLEILRQLRLVCSDNSACWRGFSPLTSPIGSKRHLAVRHHPVLRGPVSAASSRPAEPGLSAYNPALQYLSPTALVSVMPQPEAIAAPLEKRLAGVGPLVPQGVFAPPDAEVLQGRSSGSFILVAGLLA